MTTDGARRQIIPARGRSVLVTGGAGFIGCALATRLVAAGSAVTILDVLHPQVHAASRRPVDLPDAARLVVGDVTDLPTVAEVLVASAADTVVHLAAETGTAQSLGAATRHGHVNVVGTTVLLDAMSQVARPPGHVVLASSRAVYGEGMWRDEHDGRVFAPGPRRPADLAAGRWDPRSPSGSTAVPLPHRAGVTSTDPVSVYGATKLAQEAVLKAWCAARDIKLSVLRLQNVYGPGQSPTNPYTGVLNVFVRQAAAGQPIDVFEDGAIGRDFVHVDDAVAALVAAVDQVPSGTRTVDVGGGRPTTLLAVADIVATAAAARAPVVVSGRYRLGDVRAASCDLTAARDDLTYLPRWALADGIAQLVATARPARPGVLLGRSG